MSKNSNNRGKTGGTKVLSDNVAKEKCRCYISPRQLAERWDCSPTTAQRIAKNAGMAKYCLGEGRNGMVRYLLSEIESYETQRRFPCAT